MFCWSNPHEIGFQAEFVYVLSQYSVSLKGTIKGWKLASWCLPHIQEYLPPQSVSGAKNARDDEESNNHLWQFPLQIPQELLHMQTTAEAINDTPCTSEKKSSVGVVLMEHSSDREFFQLSYESKLPARQRWIQRRVLQEHEMIEDFHSKNPVCFKVAHVQYNMSGLV